MNPSTNRDRMPFHTGVCEQRAYVLRDLRAVLQESHPPHMKDGRARQHLLNMLTNLRNLNHGANPQRNTALAPAGRCASRLPRLCPGINPRLTAIGGDHPPALACAEQAETRRLNLLVEHCAPRLPGSWFGPGGMAFCSCACRVGCAFSAWTSDGRHGAGRPVAASRRDPLAGFWPH